MPQSPNVDGLPLWLQITISLAFLILTGLAVGRGYFSTSRKAPDTVPVVSQLSAQSLVDHHQEFVSLNKNLMELTHYIRSQIEVERELCGRLRALREHLDGQAL